MCAGIKFPGIKVERIVICDGHHRYVASLLANFPLGRISARGTSVTAVIHWEYNNIPIEKIVEIRVNLFIMLFFLDIDGVMVPAKGWKSPEFLNDGFPAFSSNATRTLQSLISEDVTVMLTTSHKSNFTLEGWKNIFKNRGINIEKIKALPENSNNLSRKDEIVNWFNINDSVENFVIIDNDKSLNELPDFLKKNLIQTSPYIGLTEEHSEAIKSVLHKDLQPA